MTATSDAVQAGVNAYALAEQSLTSAHDALLALVPTYQALNTAGLIGYLETNERISMAQNLAGVVAATQNKVFQNHQADTARAKVLAIDLPLPPDAHPDGGGR